ncbi:MAG: cupin domain-containing protein [Methylotenera sp.]|nr:cupin domain-containing protein [Methylotenera sp.]
MNQPLALLNQLTSSEFLDQYWQKKPLLIKAAMPNFAGLLSPEELAGLACEEDVQSRIVEYKNGQWHTQHGPFTEKDFAALPEVPSAQHNWTLLVQSVNHFLPEANALLQQFSFIPHARLDDLMVSYAPNGGGVGPHFDSYDVFLLQGQGKRLWRISEQTDLTLVEGAPLRILKNFDTKQEWLLEAGDMLYLPPHLAHWGIAVADGDKDCMTYSIGFRAPKNQELASEFLGFMQDKINQDAIPLTGMYQDTNLSLQAHPAEISQAMITSVSAQLQKIQWPASTVAEFLGRYLSDPKTHVVFDANKEISQANFVKKAVLTGLTLDLKSLMLFEGEHFFMNGEMMACQGDAAAAILKRLADNRLLTPMDLADHLNNSELSLSLFAWYQAGYLHFPD